MVHQSNEKLVEMENLKELDTHQLINLSNVLNSARFVMKQEFKASENTIRELREAFRLVESEINLRDKHIWDK